MAMTCAGLGTERVPGQFTSTGPPCLVWLIIACEAMLIGKGQHGSTGRSAPHRFRCSRLEKKRKSKKMHMPGAKSGMVRDIIR
jgi:hypothetical protein